jgi:hypothetical protein
MNSKFHLGFNIFELQKLIGVIAELESRILRQVDFHKTTTQTNLDPFAETLKQKFQHQQNCLKL